MKVKNLHWYNYSLVVLYYLISFLLTYGVFVGFFKDPSISLLIRFPLSIIYSCTFIFTIHYHFKTMTIQTSISSEELQENSIPLIRNENKSEDKCKKCNIIKPERAHHCNVCDVCVNTMDHHCPWVANCIGSKNEREFLYFLFGTFCTLLLLFGMNLPYLFRDFVHNRRNNQLIEYKNPFMFIYNIMDKNIESFTCLVSFISELGVMFITLHYLLINVKYNITSIECVKYRNNIEVCPYYNDNLKENLLRKIKPFPFEFSCDNNMNGNNYHNIFKSKDCENII